MYFIYYFVFILIVVTIFYNNWVLIIDIFNMSKLNQTIYIVIILYKLVFTKYKLFITIKTTKGAVALNN